MDQEIKKKIEEWFASLGKERFLSINASIDETMKSIQSISSDEGLLAAIEGELICMVAHITTKDQFFQNIESELSLYKVEDSSAKQIRALLEKFVSSHASVATIPETVEKNTSQQPDVLVGLQGKLTEAKTIAPTARDHSLQTPSVPQSPEIPPAAIDPYREIPK